MRQLLHLLIVDRDRRTALARSHGSRWVLPLICCDERTRAGPIVSRWLADRGLAGCLVGQWVGRFVPTSSEMDWLAVVDAHLSDRLLPPCDLVWAPLNELKSSAALLDYQQWALARAVAGELPVRAGAFGSLGWIDRVRAWATRVAGPLDDPPTCYRATPHEVVLAFSRSGRRVYFKGLTGDRIGEAVLTATLAAELPDAFAPTLALERQNDESVWWLMEECAGTPLAALDRDAAADVVAALARVQCALADVAPRLDLPEADLQAAAAWARSLVGERRNRADADEVAADLASVSESVGARDVPRSWIPLDIDPGNVLVDGCYVRFIDLDRSRCGAAPLAAATLLQRLRRRQGGSVDPVWIDDARRRYERQLGSRFRSPRSWRDFEIASMLFECHHGWRRLLQNIERGEVTGVIDVAADRTAQRLIRALTSERQ